MTNFLQYIQAKRDYTNLHPQHAFSVVINNGWTTFTLMNAHGLCVSYVPWHAQCTLCTV